MLDSQRILQLYESVLIYDSMQYNIPEKAIKNGIEVMQKVYKPGTSSLCAVRSNVADYNNPAHRCAYMHKYAAFHTAMVRDFMYEAARMNFRLFYDIISSSSNFSVCCLGGGPGTDVIGVLAALHSVFSYFDTAVNIVDYMTDWSFSFSSILRELGTGYYGAFGNNTYHFLNWRYLGANLLKTLSTEVDNAISSASLVTMIKFTSAASCIDTQNMINTIFTSMKPGAILFFIDNDAGGFHELIMTAANTHNFISIFGPVRHEKYKNEAMKTFKFGHMSCFKSTVTVHVLQKPPHYRYRSLPNLPMGSPYDSPILDNRRTVILGSPIVSYKPPLLYSPLTPFVIQPGYDDLGNVDFARDEFVHDPNNNFSTSPVKEIPQSPRFGQLHSRLGTPISQDFVNSPFTGEENEVPPIFSPASPYAGVSNFRSPIFSPNSPYAGVGNFRSPFFNPNSPYAGMENSRPPIYSPVLPLRNRKNVNLSCLPLKQWRNNLSRRINQVKSRASSLLKRRKKVKRTHPVFRL